MNSDFLAFMHKAWISIEGWFGNPLLFKACLFCAILCVSHVVKNYLTRAILAIFRALNINHEPSADILEVMLPNFVVFIGLSIAVEKVEFPGEIGFIIGNVAKSVVIAYFFDIITKITPVLIKSFVKSKSVAIEWVIKLLRGFIIFVCITTILETWGIKVGPIITGFGLFGAAVAFASKDLFENIISGAILIAENKFKQGDHIKIDDSIEGVVEVIRLRSTKLIRLDGVPVYVPNSKLASNSVINYSMRPNREIYWNIGVTYNTSSKDLKNIRDEIDEYITQSDDFSDDMKERTVVRVSEFADSSINILIICFTKSTRWSEWMEIKEQLAYRILEIVTKNNSSMAFPSYSMYLEKMPEVLVKNIGTDVVAR